MEVTGFEVFALTSVLNASSIPNEMLVPPLSYIAFIYYSKNGMLSALTFKRGVSLVINKDKIILLFNSVIELDQTQSIFLA